MPLNQESAPAVAAEQSPSATQPQESQPALTEPQRIRPPVVRTSPEPETQQPAAQQPETQQAAAPQGENETVLPVPGVDDQAATSDSQDPATATAAESKVPTTAEMENLDNPYKTARESENQQAQQEKPGQEGNPEDQPPDFPQILLTGKAAMANEDYQNAHDIFDGLLKHPQLPANLRKEILYLNADALFSLSQNNMEENFSKIMSAYNEALNYDPRFHQGLPGSVSYGAWPI